LSPAVTLRAANGRAAPAPWLHENKAAKV